MKKILLFLLALLMSALVFGATSNITFLTACGGSGTADDGAVWTITSDAAETTFDNTKGIHYGSSNKAVSYLNLSTSNIAGTITQIVINASGAKSTAAKLNITVGGNAFGSEQSLTETATNYTLTGSATGEIVIAITQSSTKKALYCKSITVTYTPNTTYTVSFVNFLGKNPNDINQSSQGGSITLPNAVEICNKCYGTSWQFEGWVETLENHEHVYTSTYTPNRNITLYALFSRGLENVYVDEYRLVTEAQDNWAGSYLIAYHSTMFANGETGGTSGIGSASSFVNPGSALVGNTVKVSWGDLYNVTLEEISEGSNTYLLKTKDGQYNYWTNNTKNGITASSNANTADDYPITVIFNSSSDISLRLGGNADGNILHYNAAEAIFRFYKNGTQEPVYLYKRVKTLYPYATEESVAPECDTAFITTWNKNKIYIDKHFLTNVNEQNVTIEDVNTGETLVNNVALSYQSSIDAYEIPVSLATRACDKLSILLRGTDSLYMIYKVPFMVDADSYTSSMVNENCDVVVLPNTTLTIPAGASANRNIKLYQGAHLSIPSGATYKVNSLSFRKDNDNVSTLGLTGTLNTEKLYLDVYLDYTKWYFTTLPQDFTVSNIKYTVGRNATYAGDFFIKYYNGELRAQTQSGAWTGASASMTFETGNGFIIGLSDELIKKELRFELDPDILSDEISDKSVGNLHAWGGNDSNLRPNHKGWNLVGNPFLNSIVTDLGSPIHIDSLVKVMNGTSWTGQWEWSGSDRGKTFRYGVFPSSDPVDADAGGYKSVVLDDIKLDPFVCFFVQMGGNDPLTNQAILFNTADRGPLMAPRRYAEEDEELFLRVRVDDWKTGCFISNQFTDEYEPGDDLESRYPIY